jgi:adenine deaminase
VEAGRIVWVEPSSQASVPAGALVVDGRGKYLVPGLTDAHVHLSPSEFPLALTHGITTIVQMHGVPDHLTWRRLLLEGPSLVRPC